MLRRLRSPAQAAKAVVTMREVPIAPFEYAALVDELVGAAKNPLPAPTLDWIVQELAKTSDPLVRHSVVSQLEASPGVKNAEILSLLASGSVEMALSACRHAQLPPDSERVKDFLASQGILPNDPTESQWVRSLEASVQRGDFKNAKKVWQERYRFLNVPVSSSLLSQFIQLIGKHHDAGLLKHLFNGINYDLPVTSPAFAAALNCIPQIKEAIVAVNSYSESAQDGLMLSDFSSFSDRLAENILDNLPILEAHGVNSALGNILLQGIYRNYTSHLVFHFYRRILQPMPSFKPDTVTAQILANAAYRLGNSKLLINEIYNEFRTFPLGRKFFETMLFCQTSGTGFSTAMFVLSEMMRRKVPIRQHIQKMVYNRLRTESSTSSFLELAQPKFLESHTEFDKTTALKESGDQTQQTQAQMNANIFLYGKEAENDATVTLTKMLDFDRARQQHLSRSNQ